jgi:hypothetical protein
MRRRADPLSVHGDLSQPVEITFSTKNIGSLDAHEVLWNYVFHPDSRRIGSPQIGKNVETPGGTVQCEEEGKGVLRFVAGAKQPIHPDTIFEHQLSIRLSSEVRTVRIQCCGWMCDQPQCEEELKLVILPA